MWERDKWNRYSTMDNNNRTRKYVLVIGTILVLTVVLAGAIKFTSQSGFCDTCHEMEPSFKAWQSSSHNSVECIKCHSEPGVIGLIKTKAQALSEVYRHITGNYKTPITITSDTAAFSNRCLRCHENIKGKDTAHNLKHFKVGAQCMGCHQGLVHNPQSNNKVPDRKVCVPCHGQEIND